MRKALNVTGHVLRYCSDAIKSDPEMVRVAIMSAAVSSDHYSVLQWASEELQTDCSLVELQILYHSEGYYRYSRKPRIPAIEWRWRYLFTDRDFVVKTLQLHGLHVWDWTLGSISDEGAYVWSDELRQDRELAIFALSSSPWIGYNPDRDINALRTMYPDRKHILRGESWWRDDDEIARIIVAREGAALRYMSERA